jgi:protein involved in polysaccharide export with SLBB domain
VCLLKVSPVRAQDVTPVGAVQQPAAATPQQPVIATPQQTNDRIRSLSEQVSKTSPHDYTIGSGDLISLSVFDVPELSRDLRVSQSGAVNIPLVPPRLQLAGLTELQAAQKIAEVLEANGLVSHPQVDVTVKERRSKPITIVGAVAHPMVYEADRRVTLLEALAEAGGVSNDAGDTVLITRSRAATFIETPNPEPVSESAPGAAASSSDASNPQETFSAEDSTNAKHTSTVFPPATEINQNASAPAASSVAPKAEPAKSDGADPNIITVNLNELLERGDTRNNVFLQAGDIVTVPHAGIPSALSVGPAVSSSPMTEPR